MGWTLRDLEEMVKQLKEEDQDSEMRLEKAAGKDKRVKGLTGRFFRG